MKKAKPTKPRKPSKTFPLTPHAGGRWCKKVVGRLYYFGSWDDPNGALQEYLAIKDELQAGHDPRKQAANVVTLSDLVNSWLKQCDQRHLSGDISPRTFADYKHICSLILNQVGRNRPVDSLKPADFSSLRNAMAAKYAPSRLGKVITVTRMFFKWGWESDLLKMPVKLGPDFKGASKRQIRERRNASDAKLFSAEECRSLIDHARPTIKAMILLGLNAGLGNADLATMKESHIQGDWMIYARGKTAVQRRVPLWGETLQAIHESTLQRPKPIDPKDNDLLFLTRNGGRWSWHERGFSNCELSKQFRKMLNELEIYKPRRTFYALRHTFQTVGDGARDPVATSAIMGHADASMAGQYRESIDDERLRAVTNHVHAWLFSDKTNKTV